MSNSVQPQRRQPTRLPRPWDSPVKNTGVGCHFLPQCIKWKVKVKSLSRVRLLVTPWTAAYQAPPSMGLSRQEYWSGLPFPSPKPCIFKPKSCNLGKNDKSIHDLDFALGENTVRLDDQPHKTPVKSKYARKFIISNCLLSYFCKTFSIGASLMAQRVKHLPAMRETCVRSLCWEDPLEKEMAPHSSIPVWRIPWTEEPDRLQFMVLQRVRHDWVTSLSLSFLFLMRRLRSYLEATHVFF